MHRPRYCNDYRYIINKQLYTFTRHNKTSNVLKKKIAKFTLDPYSLLHPIITTVNFIPVSHAFID